MIFNKVAEAQMNAGMTAKEVAASVVLESAGRTWNASAAAGASLSETVRLCLFCLLS